MRGLLVVTIPALVSLCACATPPPPAPAASPPAESATLAPDVSAAPAAPPAAAPADAVSTSASVPELLSHIEAAYRQGHYAEGLALVKRTLELGRRDISVVDRVGSIYHLLGRYGEAIAIWEQGLRLESHPERRAELERSISLARRSLGLPEPEPGGRPLSVELKPPQAGPITPKRRKRIEALYEQGVAHYALGEYLRATALFMRVLELDPGHALARSALARLRLKPGGAPGER